MTQAILDKEVSKKKFEEDPKISFIVPIYDIKPEVLKRCILSLNDQDYDNMEIVCVLDGQNNLLKKVLDDFLWEKEHKIVEIEHAGACAARNAGFKHSDGQIVSFFNSDYVAKPGIARRWVNVLKKNPDCGFVYGAYQYSSSQSHWYPSKPFDKWELEVANYIDCGFPLWRKYVVDWDVNCKSLQDWDFWIRVIKTHNVKGFYLGTEISFLAEPPRPKGLSHDSSSNWIDRVNYVKEKNGIEKRDIIVSSLGAAFHGKKIAQMIGADFRDDTIFKPNEYKALYMIGFYMKPNDVGNMHPTILSHFKNVTKIVHFVGADIYWLRKFSYENLKYLSGALNKSVDYILCENALAQKELKEFGIDSEIVPIPPYNDYELKPLPDEFSVSVFITDHSDFDKYCKEHTLSIVRAMPDIKFNAYGDASLNYRYPNMKSHGNMDSSRWKEFVYNNSCYLRLVRHDTRPMASDEFIIAGRDVISNIPAPYMEYIDTKGDADINEWDMFQGGLSPYRWPKTKKEIISTIRKLATTKKTDYEREVANMMYSNLLDKNKYKEKIRGLCGI